MGSELTVADVRVGAVLQLAAAVMVQLALLFPPSVECVAQMAKLVVEYAIFA